MHLAVLQGHRLTAGDSLSWLTSRGHRGVGDHLPADVLEALRRIFELLDGDEELLAQKPSRRLVPDFALAGTMVEFDEDQHFTIQRLATLALYPPTVPIGFGRALYAKTCLLGAKKAERAFAHKSASEFPGAHGRARQRAYFDAFRDLAAPTFGNGPVIRVAAPERDPLVGLERFEMQLANIRDRPLEAATSEEVQRPAG